MNLVLFTHPAFLGFTSQGHFARSLAQAFRERGHQVEVRQPQPALRRVCTRGKAAKLAGYIDQYLVFPWQMRQALRDDPRDTLYVFCDQALGPWVPLAAHRPHVVHCHDLLALRSALGDIPESHTGFAGRLYQRYIRRGFRRARHFISVSAKSREDLHRFGGVLPVTSEVVYNGLNRPYRRVSPAVALERLREAGLAIGEARCLLHVGSGLWYKNPLGVVLLYAAYVRDALSRGVSPLPLVMVSPPPNAALQAALDQLPPEASVQVVQGVQGDTLEALYAHAEALLFPSLAEGFGWPIVEAMACGCPVITTGEAPMTEVGGEVAVYLPRLTRDTDPQDWAQAGARAITEILERTPAQRAQAVAASVARAARFAEGTATDDYLRIYRAVMASELNPAWTDPCLR